MNETATLTDGLLTAPVTILEWHTATFGEYCATVETLPGGTRLWSTAGKQLTVNARLLSARCVDCASQQAIKPVDCPDCGKTFATCVQCGSYITHRMAYDGQPCNDEKIEQRIRMHAAALSIQLRAIADEDQPGARAARLAQIAEGVETLRAWVGNDRPGIPKATATASQRPNPEAIVFRLSGSAAAMLRKLGNEPSGELDLITFPPLPIKTAEAEGLITSTVDGKYCLTALGKMVAQLLNGKD